MTVMVWINHKQPPCCLWCLSGYLHEDYPEKGNASSNRRAATVFAVQQIMTELSGAVLEEAKILVITKILFNVMK
jgi:hypothetical protein